MQWQGFSITTLMLGLCFIYSWMSLSVFKIDNTLKLPQITCLKNGYRNGILLMLFPNLLFKLGKS